MIGRTNSISENKKELSNYYFNKIEGFWEPFSFLSFGGSFSGGAAVVLNNEIHVLGSGTTSDHYKWNGKTWVHVGSLPYICKGTRALVLNNEIHILGSSDTRYMYNHYKWNGNSWVSVSTLPHKFSDYCVAVVLNNEIHILGGHESSFANSHYKWNGSSWVSVSTLPSPAYYAHYSTGVVLNGEIRYFSGNEYYKWDGSSWTLVNKNTYVRLTYRSNIVTLDNDIYITAEQFIYKWDGYNWVSFGQNLPFNCRDSMAVVLNDEIYILYGWVGSSAESYAYKINPKNFLPNNFYKASALVLNNEIHVLGGGLFPRYNDNDTNSYNHYKWDGDSWTSASTLPTPAEPTSIDIVLSAVVLDNKIHCFINKKMYKLDGSSWIFVSDLPVTVITSVVLNNEIHILGSYESSFASSHYKWDGSSWTSVSTLPYRFQQQYQAVTLKNEIHILGSTSGGNNYNHYKWDGSSWTSVSKLPFNLGRGNAFLLNDNIYIMNGYVPGTNDIYDYYTLLYKWDGLNWTKEAEVTNYIVYDFQVVVLNNEIHIFNMGQHSSLFKVYK